MSDSVSEREEELSESETRDDSFVANNFARFIVVIPDTCWLYSLDIYHLVVRH